MGPFALTELPEQDEPATDRIEPTRTDPVLETLPPIQAEPDTLTPLPDRMPDLTESELPVHTEPVTDIPLDTVAAFPTDREEPSRAKLDKDMALPKAPKPATLTCTAPALPADRSDLTTALVLIERAQPI